jgi:hypothetical protein
MVLPTGGVVPDIPHCGDFLTCRFKGVNLVFPF